MAPCKKACTAVGVFGSAAAASAWAPRAAAAAASSDVGTCSSTDSLCAQSISKENMLLQMNHQAPVHLALTSTRETSLSGCRAAADAADLDASVTDEGCAAACAVIPHGTWPCDESGICTCETTTDPDPVPNPAPAPAPAPTPPVPSTNTCGAVWTQCGGKGWTGTTCCDEGLSCVFGNEWYYQCKPSSPSSPTPSTATSTEAPTTTVTTPASIATTVPSSGSACCSRDFKNCPEELLGWCSESQANCEGPCEGPGDVKLWLPNGPREGCTARYESCSSDADCCSPGTCVEGQCELADTSSSSSTSSASTTTTQPSSSTSAPPTPTGWDGENMKMTHYWDCSGQGCDAATLQPWDVNKYVSPPGYGPQDPEMHGGALYGEKMWLTGAASDALTALMGDDDGCCGGDPNDGGVGGCGKCALVQNPDSLHPDWTAVVMKKNRCPPWASGCGDNEPHFDIAAPGFDNLQWSLSNICGLKPGTGFDSQAQSEAVGSWWTQCSNTADCAHLCDKLPADFRAGCKLFASWGWKRGNPSSVKFKAVPCPAAFIEHVSKQFGPSGVTA